MRRITFYLLLTAVVQPVLFDFAWAQSQCPSPAPTPQPPSIVVQPTTTEDRNVRVIEHAGYDYVPSIMWDGGRYRMWWCSSGGQTGDRIYHAESWDLRTWYNTNEVFRGSGNPPTFSSCSTSSAFDCVHTCDPSVVKVGSTYYMYYGGFPVTEDPMLQNKVGVVWSNDGYSWNRYNDQPILVAANGGIGGQQYGAGHPSVIYLGGYYYMTYSDTSLDMGQHAIRATDPRFQIGLQEWTTSGWVNVPAGRGPAPMQYLAHTQNADWAYIGSLHQFVLAIDSLDTFWDLTGAECPPGTKESRYVSFRFFNGALTQEVQTVRHVNAVWLEGGGLARYSNGHALESGNCDRAYLHVIRPSDVEGVPGSQHYNDCWNNQFVSAPNLVWRSCWELGHFGYEYMTGLTRCPDAPLDYDGDSVSDQVIFRPGQYMQYREYWLNPGTVGPQVHQMPTGSVIPISGDFDGDGKTDRGVIRPNFTQTGYIDWYIELSSGGTPWTQQTWGLTTDQVVVGDFNGNGQDDIGVFRNGEWLIKDRNGAIIQRWCGDVGDIAVPGDYEGDGVTDIAIFRPWGQWTGYWTAYLSSGGSQVFQWGQAGDIPFVSNMDSDGMGDRVFYRPSTGQWNIKYAAPGKSSEVIQWGLAQDVPMVGDFDGNGINDLNVYRPSTGEWFHNFRDGNSRIVQWGGLTTEGDRVPCNRGIGVCP